MRRFGVAKLNICESVMGITTKIVTNPFTNDFFAEKFTQKIAA